MLIPLSGVVLREGAPEAGSGDTPASLSVGAHPGIAEAERLRLCLLNNPLGTSLLISGIRKSREIPRAFASQKLRSHWNHVVSWSSLTQANPYLGTELRVAWLSQALTFGCIFGAGQVDSMVTAYNRGYAEHLKLFQPDSTAEDLSCWLRLKSETEHHTLAQAEIGAFYCLIAAGDGEAAADSPAASAGRIMIAAAGRGAQAASEFVRCYVDLVALLNGSILQGRQGEAAERNCTSSLTRALRAKQAMLGRGLLARLRSCAPENEDTRLLSACLEDYITRKSQRSV